MSKLNKDEKMLLRSVESGEWHSVKDLKAETRKYQGYARATLNKDKRINIRISSKDLDGVQRKALEEGIPYQTLISSVIHKYVAGAIFLRRA
jgi:predicted DNA binding CopG/RHH family protein